MLDLPTELWRHIAHFLPPEEIKRLYSVNQTFYHLAMDETYREVRFDCVNRDLLHNVDLLKSPDIARRVRSFHISSQLLLDTEIDSTDGFGMKILSFTSRVIRRLKPTSEKIVESITNIMPNLTEVQTFSVSWHCLSETGTDIRWSFFAPNLQHLRLSIPPTHLSCIPYSVDFPKLKTFYIKFLIEHNDELKVDALQMLASFIDQQRPRLQKLAIRASRTTDVSALFLSLGKFEHLISLDLDDTCARYPRGGAGVDPSVQFMNENASTLRDLSLASKLTGSWLNFKYLHLRNLTSLLLNSNLLLPSKEFWDDQLSVFLRNVAHCLKSLVVLGPLSQEELAWLFSILDTSDSEGGLRTLAIGTASLTRGLIVQILEKLPRLDSLTLRIHDISEPGTYPVTPDEDFPISKSSEEHPFAARLRETSFDGWKLRDITVMRKSCCGQLFLWGLMKLFAECIPTVTSLAGNGHMAIPDPPNQKRAGGTTGCTDMVCSYGKAGTRTSREFPSFVHETSQVAISPGTVQCISTWWQSLSLTVIKPT